MKKEYVIILVASFVGIASATALVIMSSKSTRTEALDTCTTTGSTHTLRIQSDSFSPTILNVKRCDRIRVINKDHAARLIALGEHDNHIDYPGFEEKALGNGDSFIFTANAAGRFHMHDHVHDDVEADIIIE